MKASKVFSFIFLIIFICYIVTYISYENGYYETKAAQKTVLTNEKIKQFEADVAAGKNVELTDYLEKTKVDYSNKVSNTTLKVSKTLEKGFNKAFKLTFKYVQRLLEE